MYKFIPIYVLYVKSFYYIDFWEILCYDYNCTNPSITVLIIFYFDTGTNYNIISSNYKTAIRKLYFRGFDVFNKGRKSI